MPEDSQPEMRMTSSNPPRTEAPGFQQLFARLARGEHLSVQEAEDLFTAIMEGQIGRAHV